MTDHVFADRTIVARTRHRCVWCGERIQPRQECRLIDQIWEGEFLHHYWHLECYQAAEEDQDDSFLPYSNERPNVDEPL